jgi:hypothetical protein
VLKAWRALVDDTACANEEDGAGAVVDAWNEGKVTVTA